MGKVVTKPIEFGWCFRHAETAEVQGLIGQFPSGPQSMEVSSGAGPLAFVAGDDTLEIILSTNKIRRDSVASGQFTAKEAAYRFTAAITSVVGFPRSFLIGAFQEVNPKFVKFFVLAASAFPVPQVPTFSYFTELLQSKFGIPIPLEVTKGLVVPYAKLPNPIAAFSKVAGCDEEKVRAFVHGIRKSPEDFKEALVPDILDASCSKNFDSLLTAFQAAQPKGDACIQFFKDEVTAKRTVVAPDTLRAVYFFCFDASPLFVGNGFGFSGMVNPVNEVPFAAATFFQQIQSREFIVPGTSTSTLKIGTQFFRLFFPTIPDAKTTAKDNMFNGAFYQFLE